MRVCVRLSEEGRFRLKIRPQLDDHQVTEDDEVIKLALFFTIQKRTGHQIDGVEPELRQRFYQDVVACGISGYESVLHAKILGLVIGAVDQRFPEVLLPTLHTI